MTSPHALERGRRLTQSQSTTQQRMMKRLLLHKEANVLLFWSSVSVSVSPTHTPTQRLRHLSRHGRSTVRLNIETRASECNPLLSANYTCDPSGLCFHSSLCSFRLLCVCVQACLCVACLRVATVSQSLTAESAWEMYICTRALGNIRWGEGRKGTRKNGVLVFKSGQWKTYEVRRRRRNNDVNISQGSA